METGRTVDSGFEGDVWVGYGELRATLVLTQQHVNDGRVDCVILAVARRQALIDALTAAKPGVGCPMLASGTGFGALAIESYAGDIAISQLTPGARDAVVVRRERLADLVAALLDPDAVPAA